MSKNLKNNPLGTFYFKLSYYANIWQACSFCVVARNMKYEYISFVV